MSTYRALLCVLALSSLALMATVPSAAAQGPIMECNPTPLGPPDGNGGLDDTVKEFGNPVIFAGCVFVVEVSSSAVQLVVDTVNLVCDFATGEPCLQGEDETE